MLFNSQLWRSKHLFLRETEAKDPRCVIHSINTAICKSQAAKMNPGWHGRATLIQLLTCPSIERVKDFVSGIHTPLGNFQKGLAVVDDIRATMGLMRIFAC